MYGHQQDNEYSNSLDFINHFSLKSNLQLFSNPSIILIIYFYNLGASLQTGAANFEIFDKDYCGSVRIMSSLFVIWEKFFFQRKIIISTAQKKTFKKIILVVHTVHLSDKNQNFKLCCRIYWYLKPLFCFYVFIWYCHFTSIELFKGH